MVIGSELEGNGIQIFDMNKLLDLDEESIPVTFSNDKDLTGHFNATLPIGSVHNVVVNEEGNYGVAVGARPRDVGCKSGLQFFSLDDPSNPQDLGCNGDDGYVHDVSDQLLLWTFWACADCLTIGSMSHLPWSR